jgi:hypothetical protein
MAAYGFNSLIFALERWGVLDVILPFILIFTIVFATIERTKLLSTDAAKNKKYGTVIAMVVAFASIVPHVTGNNFYGIDIVLIINRALPQVSLLLVAIVMMLLTLGLWTGEKADGKKGIGIWFTLASGIIVIAIFISSIGWWQVPTWLWRLLNSDIIPLVVAILVFGLIIKFIAGDDKKEDKKSYDFKGDVAKFLGGGKE